MTSVLDFAAPVITAVERTIQQQYRVTQTERQKKVLVLGVFHLLALAVAEECRRIGKLWTSEGVCKNVLAWIIWLPNCDS